MNFKVVATDVFMGQLKELDKKTRRIIETKIELIERNPYRFKPLVGYRLRLFRVRFNIENRESRLVYCVIEPDVVLLCILSRDKGYRELDGIIEKNLGNKDK